MDVAHHHNPLIQMPPPPPFHMCRPLLWFLSPLPVLRVGRRRVDTLPGARTKCLAGTGHSNTICHLHSSSNNINHLRHFTFSYTATLPPPHLGQISTDLTWPPSIKSRGLWEVNRRRNWSWSGASRPGVSGVSFPINRRLKELYYYRPAFYHHHHQHHVIPMDRYSSQPFLTIHISTSAL